MAAQQETVMAHDVNLLTRTQAAKRLRLDRVCRDPERTVLAMCHRGELVGVRVSRWIMIDPSSVDRFIKGRP